LPPAFVASAALFADTFLLADFFLGVILFLAGFFLFAFFIAVTSGPQFPSYSRGFVIDYIFCSHMRSVPPWHTEASMSLGLTGFRILTDVKKCSDPPSDSHRDFLREICKGFVRQADRAK
jgi:hypothetical protein